MSTDMVKTGGHAHPLAPVTRIFVLLKDILSFDSSRGVDYMFISRYGTADISCAYMYDLKVTSVSGHV